MTLGTSALLQVSECDREKLETTPEEILSADKQKKKLLQIVADQQTGFGQFLRLYCKRRIEQESAKATVKKAPCLGT